MNRPILQKQRIREAKEISSGHAASQQVVECEVESLVLESVSLPFTIICSSDEP